MSGCPTCADLLAENRQLQREAKGRRQRIANLEAKLAEARGEVGPDELAPLIHEIGAHWREVCGHPKAKIDKRRYRAVRARLVDRGDMGLRERVEYIKCAVDGAAAGANVNERTGERYDDLELICRNESKLDSFVKRVPRVDTGTLERKLIGGAA